MAYGKDNRMSKSEDPRDSQMTFNLPDELDIDIAIIGAGISGLYSAYRLVADNHFDARQVQIFDLSDRVGGRLESVILPRMKISGELGGMRYLDSHEIVSSLVKHFRLPQVDFPMGKDMHHMVYLRKQRKHADVWEKYQSINEKFVTRYHLNDENVGFSSDQLFNKIIYDVLVQDPWFVKHKHGYYRKKVHHSDHQPYEYTFKLTSQDWDDIKPHLTYYFEGPYYNQKVKDLGFWNLIKDQVSEEGYAFLSDAGGYFSNTINWNAAEAFPYMVGDFSSPNPKYYTLSGGYDQLARKLAQAYIDTGGCIWGLTKLKRFTKIPDSDCYELEFLDCSDPKHKKTKIVRARQIILAMPRRSLELIDQSSFLAFTNYETWQHHLTSVIMEPSFKILMGFEYPWWVKHFKTRHGHSISDLPLRQCYYFGTDPNDSHSLFLGSYNDMQTVSFWHALEKFEDRFEPKKTHLIKDKTLFETIPQASKVMVAEVMKQIRELHGDASIPDPYFAWYKDWTHDPYGGGYHAWTAGYNVKKTMSLMRKPFRDENVFIVGEAYSGQQGWVEGALCVTEKMLQEHFGLSWPEWLKNKSYYLGW
jgi:monoamine oxidase